MFHRRLGTSKDRHRPVQPSSLFLMLMSSEGVFGSCLQSECLGRDSRKVGVPLCGPCSGEATARGEGRRAAGNGPRPQLTSLISQPPSWPGAVPQRLAPSSWNSSASLKYPIREATHPLSLLPGGESPSWSPCSLSPQSMPCVTAFRVGGTFSAAFPLLKDYDKHTSNQKHPAEETGISRILLFYILSAMWYLNEHMKLKYYGQI